MEQFVRRLSRKDHLSNEQTSNSNLEIFGSRKSEVYDGTNLEKYYIDSLLIGGKWAGPFDSALDYYLYFTMSAWQDRINQKYEDEETRWKNCFLLWLSRNVAPFIIHDDLNHGPFPLWHVDFGRHNILIDDFGVVTGVVDWNQARTLPWDRSGLTGQRNITIQIGSGRS